MNQWFNHPLGWVFLVAAGTVVRRTILIIVVYDIHIHTGLSLLATVSAQLAVVVCGEPAVCYRYPQPTVLV